MDDFLGILSKDSTIDSRRELQKRRIGIGIRYPVEFNEKTYEKDIRMTNGVRTINQSLYILLKTKIGERFFLPTFGTNIHKYLFEKNIYVVRDLISEEIRTRIKQWEKRIENVKIDVAEGTTEKSLVDVTIYYSIKNTSESGSFVFSITDDVYDIRKEITDETMGR